MIGSLVSVPQLSGGKVWGVVTRVENPIPDADPLGIYVRVQWSQPDIQQAHGNRWWRTTGLDFVTSPVNDGGEGNVAEDIKRKT